MSARRKGRELAVMALYAVDGLPSFEQHAGVLRFWSIFDASEAWGCFFAKEIENPHPLDVPPMWHLYEKLPLRPSSAASPFPQAVAAKKFAQGRLEGMLPMLNDLDQAITEASRGWRLQRMAQIDRNILRLGAYELAHCTDVPPPVVINEAIELSKRYSSEKSRGFINGVLDRIRRNQHQGPAVVRKRPSKS